MSHQDKKSLIGQADARLQRMTQAGVGRSKHQDKIDDQEKSAAIFSTKIGKAPDIAHAHRASDAGEDKAPAAAECVALRLLAHGVVLQITQLSLRRCTQRDS